jgi:hypothetical protein
MLAAQKFHEFAQRLFICKQQVTAARFRAAPLNHMM